MCQKCQLHLVRKIPIPPAVPMPAGLFCKVYINAMLMPKVKGYWYIIHTHCSLLSYPEWLALHNENYQTITKFIHDVLLCQWGAIEVFMLDNAPQYIQAIEYLVQKYHIHYIKILLYNSQAQGPIERRHYDLQEAVIKAADRDESKWLDVMASVFWAEQVSIQRSSGYSLFYIAHGVEPLLPFDLVEVTYLAPKMDQLMKTEDLIAQQAKMLQKRPQDIKRVCDMVMRARGELVKQLEKTMVKKIHDFDFKPGMLVLV